MVAPYVDAKNAEKENSRLKEKNLDLAREYALLKIEFEELEIKFNEVKDINIGLDEKTEKSV